MAPQNEEHFFSRGKIVARLSEDSEGYPIVFIGYRKDGKIVWGYCFGELPMARKNPNRTMVGNLRQISQPAGKADQLPVKSQLYAEIQTAARSCLQEVLNKCAEKSA